MVKADIEEAGQVVRISSPELGEMRFHAIWLRDNARDPDTRDPGNGQRLITMADLPNDLRVSGAQSDGDAIVLTFQPEDIRLSYPVSWLAENRYDAPRGSTPTPLPGHVQTWGADERGQTKLYDFQELVKDKGALGDWLGAVRRFGFARVAGMDVRPGALFDLVDLFGYVRETNYGRHFEVRTEVNPTNLAYTGLGLQAHTDNPYRDPVPTLQILHCLENSAKGGENMVVDGFAAAQRLQAENPAGYDLLTRYTARFSYSGSSGVHLTSRRAMIDCLPDGTLNTIRFNARSVAPLIDVPFDQMTAYYAAYRQFSDIIDSPDMQVSFKLEPGEAFIVDNTRVLHARLGYSGEGNRWLQGCYADKDGLLSTLAAYEKGA